MRATKTRHGLTLALVLALGTVTACGGSDGGGGSGGGGTTAKSAPGDLVVGAWGGPYNAATEKFYGKPFAASGGRAIKFDDASGTQVAKLSSQARANNVTWDMIDSVAGADAFLLEKQGLLEPLPADLKSRLVKTLGEGKVSDFGFTMGNLSYVITCNTEAVEKCPKTMAEFFDPKAFPGSRSLPSGAPLEVLTMAEVAAGVSPGDTADTDLDLDRAFTELKKVKPSVKVFWESGDQSEQTIRNGEVDMGLIWSGRAYSLQDEGAPVEINTAGGGYEPGYWTVTKGSKRKAEAFKFMEFIANQPKGQAGFSKALSYSVPNPKALDFLPKEQAERLPDEPSRFETLAVPNFAWYADNAAEVNSRWQDYVRG